MCLDKSMVIWSQNNGRAASDTGVTDEKVVSNVKQIISVALAIHENVQLKDLHPALTLAYQGVPVHQADLLIPTKG